MLNKFKDALAELLFPSLVASNTLMLKEVESLYEQRSDLIAKLHDKAAEVVQLKDQRDKMGLALVAISDKAKDWDYLVGCHEGATVLGLCVFDLDDEGLLSPVSSAPGELASLVLKKRTSDAAKELSQATK